MTAPRPALDLRRVAAGVVLPVRLTPRSGCDEVVGVKSFGGAAALKAKVRALPEDGRANQALARLMARWLKLPPSSVSIAQCSKSRTKQVLIAGDPHLVLRLIEARLTELAG